MKLENKDVAQVLHYLARTFERQEDPSKKELKQAKVIKTLSMVIYPQIDLSEQRELERFDKSIIKIEEYLKWLEDKTREAFNNNL